MFALAAALAVAAAAPLAEDPAFQHAIELYESVELEKAAQAFEGLKNDDRPPGEKALIHSWLGLTLAQLGRSEEAKQAFVDAVKLVPDVQLPAAAPPGVTALLEEARAEAQPEPAPQPEPEPEPEPEPVRPAASPDAEGGIGWNVWAGIGTVAGGLLVVAPIGGALAGHSYVLEGVARDPETFHDEAEALANTADVERVAGFGLVGVGVATALAGIALFFVPVE